MVLSTTRTWNRSGKDDSIKAVQDLTTPPTIVVPGGGKPPTIKIFGFANLVRPIILARHRIV